HHALDDRHGVFRLVLRDLEYQFIMHLEQHLSAEPGAIELRFNTDHGAAYDVGSGALQAGVDGGALVERTDRGVAVLDVRIVAFAAKQSEHVTMVAAELTRLVHVVADARKSLEIFLDVGAGFFAFDDELGGKPKG